MRRYLLLPQSISLALASSTYGHQSSISRVEDVALLEQKAIASINANANVLFGARLHNRQNTEDDEYNSQYFFACGTLLDIAKEDASINGQQVQALATLDGLCSWVRRCVSNDGHGSTVLYGLIHGYNSLEEEEEERNNNNSLNKRTTTTTTTSSALRSGKKRRSVSLIDPSSSILLPLMDNDNENKNQRQKILDAITAIATGKPRKGHSIIGAGTYRDGMVGWMALSREYAQLSSSSTPSSSSGGAVSTETAAAATINDHKVDVDDNDNDKSANPSFFSSSMEVRGSREVSLYKSRNGEVTKIEHLACTTPEYLAEAGGAMARIFFV
jgi:hypothetical protein